MERYGQHCEAFCTYSLRIQILVDIGKNDGKDHGLLLLGWSKTMTRFSAILSALIL